MRKEIKRSFEMVVGLFWGTWVLTLLSVQVMGVVKGIPSWIYCILLGICGSMIIGKQLLNMAMPSVAIGGGLEAATTGEAMGGALEGNKRNWFRSLKRLVTIAVIAVLLIVSSYFYYQTKDLEIKYGLITEELDEDIAVRIIEGKNKTTYLRAGERPVIIPKTRGRSRNIDVTKDGKVVYDKIGGLIPQSVMLPQLGAVMTSKGLSPTLGAQLLRSEDLALGLNAFLSIDKIGGSITKDVLDNSALGLSYSLDENANKSIGGHFIVYL